MNLLTSTLARHLKMRDLEILVTLDRTRSLSRTADQMAMTQPALSKWLKEFESLLKTPLFERTTRRMAPTAAGEVVLHHAQRVLGDLQRITDDLDALQSGLNDVVRVGAPSAIAAVLIPDAARHLLRQGHKLQIQLHEDTVDRLLPMLQQRELDLVLGRLDANALNAGFDHEHLYDGPVCVAAGLQHPLLERPRPTWKDAIRYPWIVPPPQSPARHSLEAAFARAGLAMPTAFMSSSSILINQFMAQQSECLFVASLHILRKLEQGNAVKHLPLYLPGVPQSVGMLWGEAVTPGVAAFMNALRVCAV